jgi:putative transposase
VSLCAAPARRREAARAAARLAARKPRWGYRNLQWALAAAPRARIAAPTAPNERWSMDFVRDELDDGRAFRVLTVIDDFTREAPDTEIDRSLPTERVIAMLERLERARGLPRTIVVDNGPEFASKQLHA